MTLTRVASFRPWMDYLFKCPLGQRKAAPEEKYEKYFIIYTRKLTKPCLVIVPY